MVRFSEMIDFKSGIAGTSPDQFEAVLKFAVILDFVVQLVYVRSFRIAIRTVLTSIDTIHNNN
ncbi:MAG: hypothetical protein MUO88_12440 [Desulfobacterales bacterium]|nr:hypothetical protein [Desulfobacterales bacterium]